MPIIIEFVLKADFKNHYSTKDLGTSFPIKIQSPRQVSNIPTSSSLLCNQRPLLMIQAYLQIDNIKSILNAK